MNEAAEVVSASMLGSAFKTVIIGGKPYTVYPPTIKIICRAIKELSVLDIDLESPHTHLTVIQEIPKISTPIIKAISIFIVGNSRLWRLKSFLLVKTLANSTPKELLDALKVNVDLIQGRDFFECAALAKSITKMAATPKQ